MNICILLKHETLFQQDTTTNVSDYGSKTHAGADVLESSEIIYCPGICRSDRRTAGQPPAKYSCSMVCLVFGCLLTESKQFHDVTFPFVITVTSIDKELWKAATKQELAVMEANNVWKQVDFQPGKNVV